MGIILVLLLIVSNIFCMENIVHLLGENKKEMIFAYVCTISFFYLWLVTEALSLIDAVSFYTLASAWGVYLLINITITVKNKCWSITVNNIIPLGKNSWLFLLYSILVLVISYHTVPYNYDSMCCHLPRIMEWAQAGSVRHFATTELLQVAEPVFAAYVQLHILVLSGVSDVYLHMIQAVSFLISGYFVYCISKRLGCGEMFCRFGAMLFLSLPIAFAEAMTTQTDNITTLIFLCFLILLLDFLEHRVTNEKGLYARASFLGIAAGLAILTKYYVLIPMGIFGVWAIGRLIHEKLMDHKVRASVFLMMAWAGGILLPESCRLIHTFGALATPGVTTQQVIITSDIRIYFISFLKNLIFNFPNGFFGFFSHYITRACGLLISWISIILHVDPNNVWIHLQDFRLNETQRAFYHHDTAQNPIVIFMFLLSIAFFGILIWKKRNILHFGYIVCSFLSIIVFMTLTIYTPFRTRYEICFFAIMIPSIVIIFDEYFKNKERVKIVFVSIVCFLMFTESVNLITYHTFRAYESSFGKRPEGYFVQHQSHYANAFKDYIKCLEEYNCEKIGIHIQPENWEYPLWVLGKSKEIHMIHVNNESSKYEDASFVPDCIVYIYHDNSYLKSIQDVFSYHGMEYKCVYSDREAPFYKYIIAIREKIN